MKRMKIAVALAATLAALSAAPARPAAPSSIDGVYRVSWTEGQLAAAGATQRYAHGNHGRLTWTLQGGTFTLDFSWGSPCHGTYAASAATISFKEGPGCHGVVAARWSLAGGLLRLRVTRATDPGDRYLFGSKPWQKIG